jgi:hypothetical protein
MRIKLFACFYNEEFLVPFFLSHYQWVDHIEALVSPCTDNTLALLAADPRVVINPIGFPGGKFDDVVKIDAINRAINESPFDADWHLVVDADELVWPPGLPGACRYNVTQSLCDYRDSNMIYAQMWTVFRHHSDSDLDPSQPPSMQRRHGINDPDAIEFKNGRKPVFTRPGFGARYTIGQHDLEFNPAISQGLEDWHGSHWTNADPAFCVKRRVADRSPRMSDNNHAARLGYHNFDLTQAKVLEECTAHMNDPLCF